jgi:hypothetical protein
LILFVQFGEQSIQLGHILTKFSFSTQFESVQNTKAAIPGKTLCLGDIPSPMVKALNRKISQSIGSNHEHANAR